MLSVIIPTKNELSGANYLPRILERLSKIVGIEIICVDSNSNDGTQKLIDSFPGVRLIKSATNSRAKRLNLGIVNASFDMILLHHPRSLVEVKGVQYLLRNADKLCWGGFQHKFDVKHPLLKFTSWYSNEVRAAKKSILYLDHCVFFRRGLLPEKNPVPVLDIFEDTALSERLAKFCAPIILPYFSTTSAYRFQRNGVYRQSLMNQALKVGYALDIPHGLMNRIYERGLNLNSQYK